MCFKKILIGLVLVVPIVIISNCKTSTTESKNIESTDTSMTDEEAIQNVKSIFYRVYLPSEMYKIFEKVGAIYTPEILNPAENVNIYESSFKAALNLGVYGVDLGYNKIFGQQQKTLLYFTVIHKLSQQLGIPDLLFADALKKMQQNFSNRDSMVKYATDIYVSANEYLNENDRGIIATLVLTGGWIEAMYVASMIADEVGDQGEIIERIAFQKYSLRSLLALLANYRSNPIINNYYLMFKALNNSYNKFEIYYFPDDLSIDTVNKLINAKKIEFNIPKENLKDIKEIIKRIRQEVVS